MQWTIPSLLNQFRRKNPLVHKGFCLFLYQPHRLELPVYGETANLVNFVSKSCKFHADSTHVLENFFEVYFIVTIRPQNALKRDCNGKCIE